MIAFDQKVTLLTLANPTTQPNRSNNPFLDLVPALTALTSSLLMRRGNPFSCPRGLDKRFGVWGRQLSDQRCFDARQLGSGDQGDLGCLANAAQEVPRDIWRSGEVTGCCRAGDTLGA